MCDRINWRFPLSFNHTSTSSVRRRNAVRLIGAIVGVVLIGAFCATQMIQAQNSNDRYDRNGRYDASSRLAQIDPGTLISVRTRQSIDARKQDGHVFPGVVDSDVWDDSRRLAIPAIPRGSAAELLVRSARDGDLILDLDAITVGGQRYAVSAGADRVDAGNNGDRAAGFIGGGAILGSIIGAIAGGGKGAAIGAAAGAGAGTVGLLTTQGREVRVPSGSVVTFRLERGLSLSVPARRDNRRDQRR
jgi:outer membrane lipoprotein SlyB